MCVEGVITALLGISKSSAALEGAGRSLVPSWAEGPGTLSWNGDIFLSLLHREPADSPGKTTRRWNRGEVTQARKARIMQRWEEDLRILGERCGHQRRCERGVTF